MINNSKISSHLSVTGTSRRRFLQSSALAAGAFALGSRVLAADENPATRPATTQSDKPPFKVVWTFDDCTHSDFNDWAPLFDAAKAKATFYAITSRISNPKYPKNSTKEQLVELEQRGHEIGSHSDTHPNLVSLLKTDPKECEREIRESREKLLSWGLKVTSFAYPNGPHNAEVEALVKAAGYTNARSSDGVNWRKKQFEPVPPVNPFAWRIWGCTGLAVKASDLKIAYQTCRDAGGSWLGILSHAAGDGPNAPFYYTHPQSVKEFMEWASGEGYIFTTVREALGV